MKTIKFIVSQNEVVLTTEFQLSEEKHNNLNVIIGTGINHINRKMLMCKRLGQSILNGSKPVVVRIVAENFQLDTKMLDAGIEGIKKELSVTIKAGYSEKNQKRFAQKVFAAFSLIMLRVDIKDITEVTGENHEALLIPEVAATVTENQPVKQVRRTLKKA